MTDLIERLEAAAEGSRELDGGIARETGWTFMEAWMLSEEYWVPPNSDEKADLPRYTTSLDAALTLVPKDAYWALRTSQGQFSTLITPVDSVNQDGNGATPALALCIAALKARAAP